MAGSIDTDSNAEPARSVLPEGDARDRRGWLSFLRSWFDSASVCQAGPVARISGKGCTDNAPQPEGVPLPVRGGTDWGRILPFLGIHVGSLGVLAVGFSWAALALCVVSYAVRMFGITAFYHRYFSHRAFDAPRWVQALGAALGNAAGQRGPLWWAAHHRRHHKHADSVRDIHGPEKGLLWAHMGWWTDRRHFATDLAQVPDLARFPELRWMDRFDVAVPLVFALGLAAIGAACEFWWPALGLTTGQALVWGGCVATVLLYHATFTINSLCHRFGTRRYATSDHSRNNGWLALLTFGEGWHNNHHHYPVSARQGFFWWELDLTYYALWLMQRIGLVRNLRPVPVSVRQSRGARTERRGAA